VEARIPLIGDTDWADHLQVVPFFDFGKGWNTRLVTPAPEDLASIGVGLRWGASLLTRPFPVRPEFEIYWGYRLLDAGTAGNNLQDHGIHLQFTLSAF
jgi:hemolysin activation/secretion protein